jgi:peptidoglycan/xylan/chitin deacetylase (PgdA/CDA1 family)
VFNRSGDHLCTDREHVKLSVRGRTDRFGGIVVSALNRKLASRLTPAGRARVRQVTDRLTAPIGSVRGVRTSRRVVALTYDDGPDPKGTPAVLAALAEAGVTATFFQLAERAERYPELVRDVLDAGHEIAVHGVDHSRLTALPRADAAARIRDARDRLAAVAGRQQRYFRPAYGGQTLGTYLATRRAGLDPVVWGPTVADWVDGDPRDIAARALTGLGPGEVVLLHDGFEVPPGDTTPEPVFDRGEVTLALLDLLTDRGYTATSVTGLLALGRPWRTAWFRP